jgi:hypothetical protein
MKNETRECILIGSCGKQFPDPPFRNARKLQKQRDEIGQTRVFEILKHSFRINQLHFRRTNANGSVRRSTHVFSQIVSTTREVEARKSEKSIVAIG